MFYAYDSQDFPNIPNDRINTSTSRFASCFHCHILDLTSTAVVCED